MCGFCSGHRYTIAYRKSKVSGLLCGYATPCPMCSAPRGTTPMMDLSSASDNVSKREAVSA